MFQVSMTLASGESRNNLTVEFFKLFHFLSSVRLTQDDRDRVPIRTLQYFQWYSRKLASNTSTEPDPRYHAVQGWA